MKQLRFRPQGRSAFTLVELLVVIAITIAARKRSWTTSPAKWSGRFWPQHQR
jgi:hypothetical protein